MTNENEKRMHVGIFEWLEHARTWNSLIISKISNISLLSLSFDAFMDKWTTSEGKEKRKKKKILTSSVISSWELDWSVRLLYNSL